MGIVQNEADCLFLQLQQDMELINKVQVTHGECLRLYQYGNMNRYRFEDGYVLETEKH